MPHLMNCSHDSDGWCLDCVQAMGEENINLTVEKMELVEIVVTLLGGEVDDAVRKGKNWAAKTLEKWQDENPDDNGLKII